MEKYCEIISHKDSSPESKEAFLRITRKTIRRLIAKCDRLEVELKCVSEDADK
jgi:hypothetical protein